MYLKEYIQESQRTRIDMGKEKNLLHASFGLITELGKLVDIFKRNIFYGKEIDIVNVKEELGDLFWYLAIISREYNIDDLFYKIKQVSNIEMSIEEIMIHLNNNVSIMSKNITNIDNSEPLNKTFFGLNFNLILTFLICLASKFNLSLEDILETNINKLKKRFPDKFTNELALNRDLEKERKVLEVNSSIELSNKVLFSTNWVKLKETKTGFQYLERKGRDSIAVLLLRIENNKLECLIRKQPLCALLDDLSDFAFALGNCPITGSLEIKEDPKKCTVREIKEEAGYDVPEKNLSYVGSYIVGTQTNEKCYMYIANVTDLTNTIPEGDGSEDEKVSYNEWVSINSISNEPYSGLAIIYLRLLQLVKAKKYNKFVHLLQYIEEA